MQECVARARLPQLSSDRDAARTSEEDARRRLVGGYEKMAEKMTDYLGSAANNAPAPATATANASSDSEGTAHTESAHDASTSLAAQTSPGQPGTVVVASAPADGAAAPAPAARKTRARPPRAARVEAPACPPASPAVTAAPAVRSEAVWAPALVSPSPAEERAPGAAP